MDHQELLPLLSGMSLAVKVGGGAPDLALLRTLASVPDAALQALQKDFAASTQVQAPELVPIRTFGTEAGRVWITYPWSDGVPMAAALQRARELKEAIPLPITARMLMDGLAGLAAMHRFVDPSGNVKPVVHGGFRADSLWLTFDGPVVVSDVGAAMVRSRMERPADEPTLMADVHAAGVLMFWALTGQPPPQGSTAALDPRTVDPNIPASVANVVQRATNPSAALRPSNAMVLVVSLENALKPLGGPASHGEVSAWVHHLIGASHPMVQRMSTVLRPYGAGQTLPGVGPAPTHNVPSAPAPTAPPPAAPMPATPPGPTAQSGRPVAAARTLSASDLMNLGLPSDAQDIASVPLVENVAPVSAPAPQFTPQQLPATQPSQAAPAPALSMSASDVLNLGLPPDAQALPSEAPPPAAPPAPTPPPPQAETPRAVSTSALPTLSSPPLAFTAPFAAAAPPPEEEEFNPTALSSGSGLGGPSSPVLPQQQPAVEAPSPAAAALFGGGDATISMDAGALAALRSTAASPPKTDPFGGGATMNMDAASLESLRAEAAVGHLPAAAGTLLPAEDAPTPFSPAKDMFGPEPTQKPGQPDAPTPSAAPLRPALTPSGAPASAPPTDSDPSEEAFFSGEHPIQRPEKEEPIPDPDLHKGFDAPVNTIIAIEKAGFKKQDTVKKVGLGVMGAVVVALLVVGGGVAAYMATHEAPADDQPLALRNNPPPDAPKPDVVPNNGTPVPEEKKPEEKKPDEKPPEEKKPEVQPPEENKPEVTETAAQKKKRLADEKKAAAAAEREHKKQDAAEKKAAAAADRDRKKQEAAEKKAAAAAERDRKKQEAAEKKKGTPKAEKPEKVEKAAKPEKAEPKPAAAEKKPQGTATVTLKVAPWADVYVDGKKKGTTPMAPLKLSAGKHQLRLVNKDLKVDRKEDVELQAGETKELKYKLNQ